MKRRSTLVLLELLMMTAVFALAAAFCLQVFAEADRMSRNTLHRDQAVRICENTAETIKITGSVSAAAHALGAAEQDGCWQLTIADGEDLFLLEMEVKEAPVPGMGAAEVRVFRSCDGVLLFRIPVGYQEVAP